MTGAPADDKDEYNFQWFVRAYWLAELYVRGESLRVSDAIPLAELHEAFPDSAGWLKKLPRWGSFCKATGYTGSAETLSMYLCLFSDEVILRCTVEQLRELAPKLKQERVQYKRIFGQNPHPGMLVLRVLRGGSSSEP